MSKLQFTPGYEYKLPSYFVYDWIDMEALGRIFIVVVYEIVAALLLGLLAWIIIPGIFPLVTLGYIQFAILSFLLIVGVRMGNDISEFAESLENK